MSNNPKITIHSQSRNDLVNPKMLQRNDHTQSRDMGVSCNMADTGYEEKWFKEEHTKTAHLKHNLLYGNDESSSRNGSIEKMTSNTKCFSKTISLSLQNFKAYLKRNIKSKSKTNEINLMRNSLISKATDSDTRFVCLDIPNTSAQFK